MAVALAGCGGRAAGGAGGVEVSPFHHIAHNAIVRVPTARRVVALTFDDGPDPGWTSRFLRLLARHHAHATFFFIGRRALAARHVVSATLQAHDEIANHSFDHPRLTRLGTSRIRWEIANGASALTRTGARHLRLFRPPFGAFDERVGVAAKRSAELMIGWDLPLDKALEVRSASTGQVSPEVAAAAIAARVRPGSIVLAHDGSGNRLRTLTAVDALLGRLMRRGYQMITVGELLRR